MDAIMPVLAAILLANADGRYARLLSDLIDGRSSRRATVAIFFAAFGVLAAASAIGAMVAGQMLGLGVLNLFAAMALVSAAGTLLWTGRAMPDAAPLKAAPAPLLFVRLLLMQMGDRNQFLIFGLGALSGAALWGIVGGAAGLLVAMLPVLGWGPALMERPRARLLRYGAAGILILWAVIRARGAFGI
jgi:putative Ca2+/H+ antiporter (TMEM165/GDT1 family)